MTQTKIILADDEERWRLIVHDFLEREGYTILEAANGRQAVDLLRENQDAALVILDIMMPEMSGTEVVTNLRREGKQTPVIFLTAKDTSLGADDGIGVAYMLALLDSCDIPHLPNNFKTVS